MNSFVEENYLKALFYLSNAKGEVNASDLAESLRVKIPTVTSMMKKFATKALVHYKSYAPVRLTTKGKQKAAAIIRKHCLTEMYLVTAMGFSWEQVHDVAEQIEHVQSPEFFAKMDELLGFPTVDLYGWPIPDKNGKIIRPTYATLSECKQDDNVRVRVLANTSDEFLKMLNHRNIHLGVQMNIQSIDPSDGSMLVSYHQHSSETLSSIVCQALLVEKI